MKVKKIKKKRNWLSTLIVVIISGVLATIFTKFMTYAPLSHNPQGTYCETQATKVKYPRENGANFVEIDGKYVVYNSNLHKGYEVFYHQHDGGDIHSANSKRKSTGSLCKLTTRFYLLYSFLFISSFLFFWGSIYMLRNAD